MSADLAQAGCIIVSGLALGIDACAHRGGLRAGGCSVAVTACGPEQVCPRTHHELAEQIKNDGLVLSEFALGTAPVVNNRPRRNRTISGLSTAVVVADAALRSGSPITARAALE